VAAIGSLPTDRPRRPHAFGRFASAAFRDRGGGLVGLGRPRVIPGIGSLAHHPFFARRENVLGKMSCVSASIARDRPAGPKQSAATGTTGEPRGTGPTRFRSRLADARARLSSPRRRRQVRSGASHEVLSPAAHAGVAARKPGRMPAVPDDPASAFSPSARALLAVPNLRDGVRPCGFALRRACVGVAAVADAFGGSVRAWASLFVGETRICERCELPASALTGAGADLA